MRLMDEQFLQYPFWYVRRLSRWLREKGYEDNRKGFNGFTENGPGYAISEKKTDPVGS